MPSRIDLMVASPRCLLFRTPKERKLSAGLKRFLNTLILRLRRGGVEMYETCRFQSRTRPQLRCALFLRDEASCLQFVGENCCELFFISKSLKNHSSMLVVRALVDDNVRGFIACFRRTLKCPTASRISLLVCPPVMSSSKGFLDKGCSRQHACVALLTCALLS